MLHNLPRPTPPLTRMTVKVTTECGASWITGINATLEGATAYLMGHRFEKPDETTYGRVIKVELV